MILVGDYIPRDRIAKLPEMFKNRLVLANLEGPICEIGLPRSNKSVILATYSPNRATLRQHIAVRILFGEQLHNGLLRRGVAADMFDAGWHWGATFRRGANLP